MRHFLLAALAVCSILPVPTRLDGLVYTASTYGAAGEIVEPSEAEALGPAVDARFGRTWKVNGLFGSGSAGLILCRQMSAEGMWELAWLSAAHVTNENGDQFFLENEVLGILVPRVSATFVHPTEDAVVLTAVVDEATALAVLPTLMDIRWENLNLGERVLLDGFGAGDRWISEGRASAPRRISIDLFFGDSGSPLQDAEGRICGIVVMRGPAPHHGHIVPMVAVREWLAGLGIR